MKKVYNITQKAAVAVLAILLAASCVFEKENPVGHSDARQHVAVQLGIGTEGMAQTKADSNTGTPVIIPDPENPVQPLETTIKTLRIFAYTKENANFILCGYYQAFAKADGTFNTTGHVMDLNLPSSGTVKVYFRAVANESAMLPGGDKTGSIADNYAINVGRDPQTGGLVFPDAIGFDELNNILYTVDQKFQNGMPMYADQEVLLNVDNVGNANTGDHEGHFILQEKVNLTLTRSLAKIEVYAAEDAGQGTSGKSNAGIQITEVELMNVIANGPLFPAEASTDILKTNPKLDGKDVALSASATDKADPSKYTKITDAYYLAENDYGVDGEFYYGDDLDAIATTDNLKAATTLKIGYKVGNSDKTGYVIMPPIERNTCYKVLARITAGGQMTLTFVAQPWNLVEESWDFTDQISVVKPFEWTGGSREKDEELGKEIISTKTANLTCSFNIATPTGATWKAEFIPVSGDPKAFKFVTQNGLEDSVTGNVGTVANLIIQPRVTNVNQENEVKLRITVITKDGLTIFAKALMPENAVADEFTIIQSY